MRWKDQRESDNVIDERGRPVGARGIGLGSVVLVLVVSYFTGQNPLTLLSLLTSTSVSTQPGSRASYRSTPEEEESKHFLSVVLGNTEDVWREKFREYGKPYSDPNLVVFTDEIASACGYTASATGPFYCPGDHKLYIDIGFLSQLQHELGAEGDFAAAYVVAHEVGHHVQSMMGIDQQVRRLQAQSDNPNEYQVKMELQADCFAGIWANSAEKRGLLEIGDVEEGINAAKAVGDDRIQSMSGGRVNPDGFTHGSSAERAKWFKAGLATGDIKSCDTLGFFG